MRLITLDLFTSEIVDLLFVNCICVMCTKGETDSFSVLFVCIQKGVCEGFNFLLAFKTMSYEFILHLYTCTKNQMQALNIMYMLIAETDGS